MINARDVRVGNWVEHSGGRKPKMITVEDFWSHYDFQDGKDRFYYYDPIPLTPEILEGCGFKECSCGGWKTNNGIMVHLNEDLQFDSYVSVRYLHQLQNLYYSLTGKELEVKITEPINQE